MAKEPWIQGRQLFKNARRKNTEAHLMTKLIIATLKFSIRYPDRQTIGVAQHLAIDIIPQHFSEFIRIRSECPDP